MNIQEDSSNKRVLVFYSHASIVTSAPTITTWTETITKKQQPTSLLPYFSLWHAFAETSIFLSEPLFNSCMLSLAHKPYVASSRIQNMVECISYQGRSCSTLLTKLSKEKPLKLMSSSVQLNRSWSSRFLRQVGLLKILTEQVRFWSHQSLAAA